MRLPILVARRLAYPLGQLSRWTPRSLARVDNASRWDAAPSADRHGGRYAQLELEIGVIFMELKRQLGRLCVQN
jgi:hypothetical protein